MKLFVFLVVCGVVCAEPPRFRSSRLRGLSRQEVAPAPPPAPEADPAAAPYAPSGWKPDGDTFELPTETEAPVAPVAEYGAPDNEYGPPPNEYGPPANEYLPSADAAAPEDPPADNPDAESVIPLGQDGTNGRLRSAYVLLVDPAALQRVQIAPRRAPAKLRRGRF